MGEPWVTGPPARRMRWTLLGVLSVARGAGADVSRSAAGRAAGEALWLPSTLLPRYGVRWTAGDDRHATARYRLDGTELTVRYTFDEAGRVAQVVLDRWGDPRGTGRWSQLPFGVVVTGHAAFGGCTVASEGRAGWYAGTERAAEGEFFRYRITDLRPTTGPPG